MTDLRPREDLIETTNALVKELGLHVVETELDRPYGLSYRFAESDAEKFIDTYFADIKNTFTSFENLSPKFLVLMPGSCFSWQYHNRRKEIWRILEGPMTIKVSPNNEEPKEAKVIGVGELVQMQAGIRHRLAALDNRGMVAEIWQHLDPKNPSDETDIVRLQDIYGRPKYRLK